MGRSNVDLENRIRNAAADYIRSGTPLPLRVNGAAILPSDRLLAHVRGLEISTLCNMRERVLQTLITKSLGTTRVLAPAGAPNVRGWDAAEILALAVS